CSEHARGTARRSTSESQAREHVRRTAPRPGRAQERRKGCQTGEVSSRTEQLEDLRRDIERAGYYPALVSDVLELALAGEEVRAHLVHQETIFERPEVRRHITTLVLTPSRLVLAHVDDIPPDAPQASPTAAATTEAVPLSRIRSVGLTHGVADPASSPQGEGSTELTMALNWGVGAAPRPGAGHLRRPQLRGRPWPHRHLDERRPRGANQRTGRRAGRHAQRDALRHRTFGRHGRYAGVKDTQLDSGHGPQTGKEPGTAEPG